VVSPEGFLTEEEVLVLENALVQRAAGSGDLAEGGPSL
jgi:hypothetical protein